jgi:hypothetical protein
MPSDKNVKHFAEATPNILALLNSSRSLFATFWGPGRGISTANPLPNHAYRLLECHADAIFDTKIMLIGRRAKLHKSLNQIVFELVGDLYPMQKQVSVAN